VDDEQNAADSFVCVPDRELPVCVLGMGRSGTSLTARVLNLLGVDLGPETGLIPASPQNRKGYWERRAIFELNDAVLSAMGGNYANPPPLRPGWHRSSILKPLKQRARILVAECFGASPLWGFKDPRTSLTLPFWRDVIPRMRYVICVRDPAEVAASFERYASDGSSDARSWPDLWLLSTARALLDTGDSPRMLAFYEDYFDNLNGQVEHLAAFIGRPMTSDGLASIEDFVERDLRHWTDPGGTQFRRRDNSETRTLYDALRTLPPCPRKREFRRVERLADRLLRARVRRGGPAFLSRRRSLSATAPSVLQHFPADLIHGVERFGIADDGWVEKHAYVALTGGGAVNLVIQGAALPCEEQRVEVLVNGRPVASESVAAGDFEVQVPLRASRRRRRIELRWKCATPLAPPDQRQAAARLTFIGLVPPTPTIPFLAES